MLYTAHTIFWLSSSLHNGGRVLFGAVWFKETFPRRMVLFSASTVIHIRVFSICTTMSATRSETIWSERIGLSRSDAGMEHFLSVKKINNWKFPLHNAGSFGRSRTPAPTGWPWGWIGFVGEGLCALPLRADIESAPTAWQWGCVK